MEYEADMAYTEHPGNQSKCSLLTLPTELVVHVFMYVDAKFLSHTVSLVCKQLRDIIADPAFWKHRITSRWPKPYPLLTDAFDWRSACIARENVNHYWTCQDVGLTAVSVNVSFASLDAVHFAQNGTVLAVGCRDHTISAYDTQALLAAKNPKESVLFTNNTHKGWVWSLSSSDGLLCSSSWDGHVMTWDLAASGQQLHDFKCNSAVLCTSFTSRNELISGNYDKRIYLFDLRMQRPAHMLRRHSRPVLCLTSDENWIISGSEDGTVVVTDRRNSKVFTTSRLDNYATSFSYDGRLLYVGCRNGSIELFSVDAHRELKQIETFDTETTHRMQVTSICHTMGAVFSSSKDRTFKVWEPSLRPGVVATISCDTEISKMDYARGVLGLGCCNGSLRLYHSAESREKAILA